MTGQRVFETQYSMRRGHLPVLFASLGYIGLGVTTLQSDSTQEFLEQPFWSIGAFMVGILAALVFFIGGSVLRRATAAVSIGYALSRGIAFAQEGVWGPLMVWIIVISLTVLAYRAAVREDYVR